MKSRVIANPIVRMDDMPVRLQDASLPGKMRTARVWLARGCEEAPYNVLVFQTSRAHGQPGRDGPADFLNDFEGYVTVDAYGVNEGVYLGAGQRIIASGCHAHVRRKFEATKSNDPKRAAQALSFYHQLFNIEDACAELSDEDRLSLGCTRSRPAIIGTTSICGRIYTTCFASTPVAIQIWDHSCRTPGPTLTRITSEATEKPNLWPERPKPRLVEPADES